MEAPQNHHRSDEPIVRICDLHKTYFSRDGFPELLPIGTEPVIVTGFGLLTPLLGYGLYKAAERKVWTDGTLAEF